MRRFWAFLFLSIFCLPSAATARYPETVKNGWIVSQEGSSCNAMTVFEDDSILSFWVDWRDDTVIIFFTNSDWKSLEKRNGEEVRFDFELLGDVEFDKWYADKADIIGKESFYGFKLWWDKEHKMDLFANWSVANGFRATADGRNLGQFTLNGSKAAILELVGCASDGLKNDRSDPFAG